MHYLPATTADARQEKTDARLHKIAQAVTLLEEGAAETVISGPGRSR